MYRRRMRLKKSDFEEHGYTDGCIGCNAQRRGMTPQSHSEQCRARLEKLLSRTDAGKERVKAAADRITEAIATRIQLEAETAEGEQMGHATAVILQATVPMHTDPASTSFGKPISFEVRPQTVDRTDPTRAEILNRGG